MSKNSKKPAQTPLHYDYRWKTPDRAYVNNNNSSFKDLQKAWSSYIKHTNRSTLDDPAGIDIRIEKKFLKDLNFGNIYSSSVQQIKNTMHQAADPDDAGWDLVKGWFDQGDDDDTVETPLPENYCKKCRAKMRELNTGFRKKMYACPNCDK